MSGETVTLGIWVSSGCGQLLNEHRVNIKFAFCKLLSVADD